MRKTLPWVVGVALAIAAGAVSVATTSMVDQRAPFVVTGAVGDEVTSRSLPAVVHDATFTNRVRAGDWHADGNWLVVTLVASAPQTEVDAAIELATLEADGQIFQASERPGRSLVGARLHVGTDTVGMLAFELPERVRGGDAVLRLSPTVASPRLDDLVVLPLPLDGLPSEGNIDIEDPQWGAP